MIHGKIYKLVNTADSAIYIGSTVSPLSKRFYGHKQDALKCPNQRVYAHLVPIGWENVRIILIENYTCSSKEELRAREQYYIDSLRPSLNTTSASGNICEHNRVRCQCKYCGGAGFCVHNRFKSQCIECGGISICEHQRLRNHCAECGGSAVCEHRLQRICCKVCSPIECDFCDETHSKMAYKQHVKTIKHKKNYKAERIPSCVWVRNI